MFDLFTVHVGGWDRRDEMGGKLSRGVEDRGENVFDWGLGDNLLKRDEGSGVVWWRSDVSREGVKMWIMVRLSKQQQQKNKKK